MHAKDNGETDFTDLLLSHQHRVQISDWRAEYLFAKTNELVFATHLVSRSDVVIDATDTSARMKLDLQFPDLFEVVAQRGTAHRVLRGIKTQAVVACARMHPTTAPPTIPTPAMD